MRLQHQTLLVCSRDRRRACRLASGRRSARWPAGCGWPPWPPWRSTTSRRRRCGRSGCWPPHRAGQRGSAVQGAGRAPEDRAAVGDRGRGRPRGRRGWCSDRRTRGTAGPRWSRSPTAAARSPRRCAGPGEWSRSGCSTGSPRPTARTWPGSCASCRTNRVSLERPASRRAAPGVRRRGQSPGRAPRRTARCRPSASYAAAAAGSASSAARRSSGTVNSFCETYAASQRPSALAASTSAIPGSRIRPAAVSSRDLAHVDLRPPAARPAGDVLLEVPLVVEATSLPGDPAPAEPDVDGLVAGHRRDAGRDLGQLEPDPGLLGVVLGQPGVELVGVAERPDLGAVLTGARHGSTLDERRGEPFAQVAEALYGLVGEDQPQVLLARGSPAVHRPWPRPGRARTAAARPRQGSGPAGWCR